MVFLFEDDPSHGDTLSWVLAFQQIDEVHEGFFPKGIIGVFPVPEVKEHKLDWSSSGLSEPNPWRDKRSFLDRLLG